MFGYNFIMHYIVEKVDGFDDWLKSLRDIRARLTIAKRINRTEFGNFGDHKAVGEGVSELRIDVGQGYRVYYTIRKRRIIFLLCGGNKSTQQDDIKRAISLAKEV